MNLATSVHRLALVAAIVASLVAGCFLAQTAPAQHEERVTPRRQPGAGISVYAPEQHDLYDGHFILSASRVYQVGGLKDPPGWNHMSNDSSNVGPILRRGI